MDVTDSHRRRLLEQSRSVYYDPPISDATARAFLDTPRHHFVTRYRQWGSPQWHHVRPDNLQEHLAVLYADHPLILSGDNDDDVPSTISEPSFVLRMLDLLQLKPGHKVFELGTGSGWNAALMAHLVGPSGRVYSSEIIPDIAKTAATAIERLRLTNVDVIAGDGGAGYAPAAPYDRAVFTAGSYDLPRAFHEQVVEGGFLLAVIKSEGGGDTLLLLRKTHDGFVSLEGMPCGFVQLRGEHRTDDLEPLTVEALPGWEEVRHHEVSRTPFWWGGKGRRDSAWRTLGIRSFLGIAEPSFRAFKTVKSQTEPRDVRYFGLSLEGERSVVLAKDDALVAYGNTTARDRLLERVREWVELGMPTAASLALRIYPSDVVVTSGPNEWLVRRKESQFLWGVNASEPRPRR